MEISGAHLSYELTQIKVTEFYYASLSFSQICADLQAKYLTGYLSAYTISCSLSLTDFPTINWNEKSFWDCLNDLCKLAEGECYVSDSKVITLRDSNSHENNDEAIVWTHTMVDCSGLGTQSITAKNKIKVYGDDGSGLPIIYTSENSTQQDELSLVKEDVIQDTKINSITQAQETADAEKEYQNTTNELEGECESLILPSLEIGDKIWISNPIFKVHQQSRVYKFSHKFPSERTLVTVGRVRKTPQLFKKRADAELALATITNPYKAIQSVNFTFDDFSDITSYDSNIIISSGVIKLSSGSQGAFTTRAFTFDFVPSAIHTRAIGSILTPTVFQVSTDGGITYQVLTLEGLTTLSNPSSSLIFKVTINNGSTELDSVAFLVK